MSSAPRILIGLYGRKGTGKSFLASLLPSALGESIRGEFDFQEESFASPIKEYVINALGLEPISCYGSDKDKMVETPYDWENITFFDHGKTGKMTAREVMQVVGTEMGRDIWGKEMWINAAHSRIKRFFKDADPDFPAIAVITDVRFDNEIDGLHRMGGQIWHIKGPQRIDDNSHGDTHSSEDLKDDINADAVINNSEDMTEEGLIEQIVNIFANVDWTAGDKEVSLNIS